LSLRLRCGDASAGHGESARGGANGENQISHRGSGCR
jgi:hypothetical protein